MTISAELFQIAVKSTIDKYAFELAMALGMAGTDVAASDFESRITNSDEPAICWDFNTWEARPRDPIYFLEFELGAITALDPAQYTSLQIAGAVASVFETGSVLAVMDYSGVTPPTEEVGSLYIINTVVLPRHVERVNGVRFTTVQATAVRN